MLRTDILDVATELCSRHNVRGFILPANTGTTARAFRDRFGGEYQCFAVGNPTSSHAKGYVKHSGMDAATQAALAELGFHVVLQEVSAFQVGDSPVTQVHAARMQASYEASLGGVPVEVHGSTLPSLIERVIRGLLDEQVRVCVEIALMAGESDAIDLDATYISVATPSRYMNARDCAVVLRPSTVATFFQAPPFIFEIARSSPPGS